MNHKSLNPGGAQMVTLERVPAAVEALVEALECDLLQQEWLLAALQESAGSGVPACIHPWTIRPLAEQTMSGWPV